MDGSKSPANVENYSSSFKKMQIPPISVPNHSKKRMIQSNKKGHSPMNAEILKSTQNILINPEIQPDRTSVPISPRMIPLSFNKDQKVLTPNNDQKVQLIIAIIIDQDKE